MQIAFRPHHFLCALCFQGKGYSPQFIANFTAIMAYLNTPLGENTPITVTAKTDSICSPCPHNQQGLCETDASIAILDNAHKEALNLQIGDKITWKEAKKLIAKQITLPTFHRICDTCSWKKLGICENTLKDL